MNHTVSSLSTITTIRKYQRRRASLFDFTCASAVSTILLPETVNFDATDDEPSNQSFAERSTIDEAVGELDHAFSIGCLPNTDLHSLSNIDDARFSIEQELDAVLADEHHRPSRIGKVADDLFCISGTLCTRLMSERLLRKTTKERGQRGSDDRSSGQISNSAFSQ